MAGPSRVLMSTDHSGVRAHRPVLTFGLVAPRPQPIQDLLPPTVQRPAAMPVVRGLPVAIPGRQVAPHSARPRPMEDPVDHRPVIIPPRPVHVLRRQQRHQPHPLLISQIVTLQTLFVHTDDLYQDRQQDHGTRPRRRLARRRPYRRGSSRPRRTRGPPPRTWPPRARPPRQTARTLITVGMPGR